MRKNAQKALSIALSLSMTFSLMAFDGMSNRNIAKADDTARTSLNGYASEGATVTTYDDCTVYNNIDFTNEKHEAYATYISPKSGEEFETVYESPEDYNYLTRELKVVAKRGEKSSEGVAEEVTVVGKDITKASLAIADIAVIYNGNEQKVPVSVIADDKQLVEGTDYELVFEDNVNAGTAKVIVNGIGLYEGKLEGEFTIAQANIEDDIVKKDLSNLAESYEYKVAEIQPQIKMSQGDVYLSAMKDYEIVYSDNMNPGTVTMTIKGIGNYTGTIEKTFVITKKTC